MKSLNDVTLLGNVGQQPEFKDLKNGSEFCKLSLATNTQYKDRNGEIVKNTTWHNITAFGKIVNIFKQYVNKGDKILVKGEINNSQYKDKDGVDRFYSSVKVNDLVMLGSGSSETTAQKPKDNFAGYDLPEQQKVDEEDDLPY